VPGFKSQDQDTDYRERREFVQKELKRALSPEFLNRIDEIVVFDPLTTENLVEIAGLMLDRLNRVLKTRNVRVEADESALRWLVDSCCADRSYGARPLRRGIQQHVEDIISERLIQERPEGEAVFYVTVEGGELVLQSELERSTAGVP
jgi:ATP-dependent Clp protease ATP-binding subunit ClpC